MTKINQYAISAALGSSLGPAVTAPPGQIASGQLASTISSLQHRRRYLWVEEFQEAHGLSGQFLKAVRSAFLATRGDQSVERVIVDQSLNKRFLTACRCDFGLEASDFQLNLALLGLRKRGQLRKLRSSRPKTTSDQWRYAYASEIAARTVFYTYGMTVDTMICHPDVSKEFDAVAESLAPGYSSFEYRWTALNIRKKGTTVRNKAAVEEAIDWSDPIPFDRISHVPEDEGVYALQEDGACLLVSTSEDLYQSIDSGQRIASANVFSPELWTPDPSYLQWRYIDLAGSDSEFRYGVVRKLVGDLRPVFNIPRGIPRKPAA